MYFVNRFPFGTGEAYGPDFTIQATPDQGATIAIGGAPVDLPNATAQRDGDCIEIIHNVFDPLDAAFGSANNNLKDLSKFIFANIFVGDVPITNSQFQPLATIAGTASSPRHWNFEVLRGTAIRVSLKNMLSAGSSFAVSLVFAMMSKKTRK